MYAICKLLYITVFALLSAVPPYLQIYFHDVLRFSNDQIGFTLAIAPFFQSLACPVWTYLVDKRPHYHGSIMAGTSLVGGLAILGVVNLGHHQQPVAMQPPGSAPSAPAPSYSDAATQQSVLMTSFFVLMFAFFTLPNVSLVDSAVMKILGPNKILYGEQRLWGSVSTGFTILVVGELINLTGNLDAIFWVFAAATVAFMMTALATNVASSGSCCGYDADGSGVDGGVGDERSMLLANNAEHDNDDPEKGNIPGAGYQSIVLHRPSSRSASVRGEAISHVEGPLLGDDELTAAGASTPSASSTRATPVSRAASSIDEFKLTENLGNRHATLFKSPRVICFLITTLLFGVALSMIVNFLFLFLSGDLHMPASWIGWTGPLGGLTELLSFCFSKQMMEHFGTAWLIVVAHLCTSVRCLAYTILPPDALSTNIAVLLLQTLHGVGFGIFWGTAVREMDSLFPPDQRAVAQGVLGAIHTGLGTGLGALLGGCMYEYFGAAGLFHTAAALSAFSAAIFCIGRHLDRV